MPPEDAPVLPDQSACPNCGSQRTPKVLPPSDFVKCPNCDVVHAYEWRNVPQSIVQEHRGALAERDRLQAENEALKAERDRAVETRENANAVSVRVEGEAARLRADLMCRQQEIAALMEPLRKLVEGRYGPDTASIRGDFWEVEGQWTVWLTRAEWEKYRDLLGGLSVETDEQEGTT